MEKRKGKGNTNLCYFGRKAKVERPKLLLLGFSCLEMKFMTMHTIIELGEGSRFW